MSIPGNVKSAFSGLSKAEQKQFRKEFSKRSKGLGTAYLAWLLLGWHYLYLGRVGMQFAFWITGGFLLVGWVFDFFRLPGMIARHNEDVARQLMVDYKAIARA